MRKDRSVVIYYDTFDGGYLSLVHADWEKRNVGPLRALADASTWGAARALNLPMWLTSRIEEAIESGEFDDQDPFDSTALGLTDSDLYESGIFVSEFSDAVQLFAESDFAVLEKFFETHATGEGTVYTIQDMDGFVSTARGLGYRIERGWFLSEFESAFYALC